MSQTLQGPFSGQPVIGWSNRCRQDDSVDSEEAPESMESGNSEPVRELFEQWELYDAIIQHDYMRHQSLSEAIAATCASQWSGVLDLGCGDDWLAWHTPRPQISVIRWRI